MFFFPRTPLHCAAANNATDLSRFLIEHGACILAVTTLEKKTPLQCCERGQPGYFNCTRYLNGKRQECWNYGIRGSGVAIFPFEIIFNLPPLKFIFLERQPALFCNVLHGRSRGQKNGQQNNAPASTKTTQLQVIRVQ